VNNVVAEGIWLVNAHDNDNNMLILYFN